MATGSAVLSLGSSSSYRHFDPSQSHSVLLFICRRLLQFPFRTIPILLQPFHSAPSFLVSYPHPHPSKLHLKIQHQMSSMPPRAYDQQSVHDAMRTRDADPRPSSSLALLPADILLEIAYFLNTFSDRLHFSATVSILPHNLVHLSRA